MSILITIISFAKCPIDSSFDYHNAKRLLAWFVVTTLHRLTDFLAISLIHIFSWMAKKVATPENLTRRWLIIIGTSYHLLGMVNT